MSNWKSFGKAVFLRKLNRILSLFCSLLNENIKKRSCPNTNRCSRLVFYRTLSQGLYAYFSRLLCSGGGGRRVLIVVGLFSWEHHWGTFHSNAWYSGDKFTSFSFCRNVVLAKTGSCFWEWIPDSSWSRGTFVFFLGWGAQQWDALVNILSEYNYLPVSQNIYTQSIHISITHLIFFTFRGAWMMGENSTPGDLLPGVEFLPIVHIHGKMKNIECAVRMLPTGDLRFRLSRLPDRLQA